MKALGKSDSERMKPLHRLWFALDDARCRIIDSEGQTMTMMKSPSPPKTSRSHHFARGRGRKHVFQARENDETVNSNAGANDDPFTTVGYYGFGAFGRDEQRENFESSGMMGVEQESALDQAQKPQFQRSAVADAFERQTRTLAAL